MPQFSDDFLERIKDSNRIEDVVRQYVDLKRAGRYYKCNCPFHSERTPSCVIYPDNESFYCFGCHAGGSVITFIQKIENLDFAEAVKFLADRAGMSMPDEGYNDPRAEQKKRILEMNRTAAKFFYSNLKTPDGRAGLEYLTAKRRIMPETIKSFGLGVATNHWTALTNHMLALGYSEDELISASLISRKNGRCFDFFVNRVMFPIFDLRGNIVAFSGRTLESEPKGMKYLNSRVTPVYEKSRTLFAMNFAKNAAAKSKRLILCEGNLDVITLHQAGFPEAVATCGTAMTAEHARLMSQYCDEVYICYDADAAGQKATTAAISLLSAAGLKSKVVKISGEGIKDVDDYINRLGSARFRLLLSDSEGSVEFELAKCREGLDVDTESGKVDSLKKTVAVLAGIESAVSRDVYISKVAQENLISKDALKAEVDSFIERKAYAAKKKERELPPLPERERNTDPDRRTNAKYARAEDGIISYLFSHPDAQRRIYSSLDEDCFVTAFNKRVYRNLKKAFESGVNASLTALEGVFSGDEMGRISHIMNESRRITIDEKTLSDYVELLKSSKGRSEKVSDMTDDAFSEYFARLKREKK